jgi:regulator of sigma E protease
VTITIIATIIVLGVLIFAHELGHFLAAKWARVGVLTFSLGFGPKLFGKKVGETQYQVSLIPLGGYVTMVGEEPGEKIPPELIAKSFSAQPVSRRLAIVFAGPFFNFLFAVVAFAVAFTVGLPTLLPEVGEVKPDFPAFQAGLQKGDRILEVNGAPVKRWEDLAKAIHESTDQPLNLKVEREKQALQLSVTPQVSTQKNLFGDDVRVGLIGISPSGNTFIERTDPFTAVYRAVLQSWRVTELTVISIYKIIEGKISAKTIGGPILIAQLAGQQAKAGVLSLVIFMAVISINLVILNILPIPVLDGWHLLMFLIEGVIGRPVSLKLRERAQQIGIFFIILLMLLVFYNDISRIIGPE